MNLSPIESFLEKNFKDVDHRASKKLYCAQLVRRNNIAARFYFDYSGDVLGNDFDLAAYQENNISSDYYKITSSLQWNLNLVFVITRAQYNTFLGSPRKTLIEADRLYCRKQFCADDDLDSLFPLSSKPVSQETSVGDGDLAVRWAQRLATAGLGEILSEIPIAKVVRRIIDPPANCESAMPELTPRNVVDPAFDSVSLDQITIQRYRRKPAARVYPLGDVNLLGGPNGVGKTSFLEAIELCLCGKTFRSNGATDGTNEIDITYLVRGSTVPLKSTEDNKLFQNRDLHWYNNRYNRGNYLFQGFNKFNFYDTDQAYRLAHGDPNSIRDAFTSLALGERAVFFDERIREVRRKLNDELAAHVETFTKLEEQVRADKNEIKELTQGPQNPGPNLDILGKELLNLSWRGPAFDGTEVSLPQIEEGLIEARVRLQSILTALGPWMHPVSMNALQTHHHKLRDISTRLFALEPELDQGSRALSSGAEQLAEKSKIISLLQKAHDYASTGNWERLLGLGERIRKRNNELKRLLSANDILVTTDMAHLRTVTIAVEGYLHDLTLASTALQSEQAKVSVAIESANAVMDKLGQLTANLRQTGLEIIAHTSNKDTCPLCHAHYSAGELRQRIESSQTVGVNEALDELVDRRNQLTIKVKEANRLLADANKLHRVFLEFSSESPNKDTTVETMVLVLDGLTEMREDLVRQIDTDAALQSSLVAKGLSEHQLLEISEALSFAFKGFDIRQQTEGTLNQLIGRLAEEISALRVELAQLKEQQLAKEREFISECAEYISQTNSLPKVIATIRERSEECRISIENLREVERSIPVKDSILLYDLLAALNRSLGYINESKRLHADLETRSKAVQLRTNALEKASIELQKQKKPIQRIKKALEPLEYIVKHDSKDTALDKFFLSYKGMILQIFQAIHSPKEFNDISISEKEVTLQTFSGNKVCLNQISTGQRAALALSIFLALNTSLQHGPSMILIDDPVASVDDINCVAFLDFLREYVVNRNRQLFFATANSKLANLVSKKFDFLGSKMVTIELAN